MTTIHSRYRYRPTIRAFANSIARITEVSTSILPQFQSRRSIHGRSQVCGDSTVAMCAWKNIPKQFLRQSKEMVETRRHGKCQPPHCFCLPNPRLITKGKSVVGSVVVVPDTRWRLTDSPPRQRRGESPSETPSRRLRRYRATEHINSEPFSDIVPSLCLSRVFPTKRGTSFTSSQSPTLPTMTLPRIVLRRKWGSLILILPHAGHEEENFCTCIRPS